MDNQRPGNLFLLGAGFDRAIFGPKIPLNDELLSHLTERLQGTAQEVGGRLKHYLDKYPTKNIEVFLTFLDLEIIRDGTSAGGNFNLPQFRKDFNVLIVDFFLKFRFKESLAKSWMEQFVRRILSYNDSIISLNYTCFIDGLLDFYEKWSPYGFPGGYSKRMGPTSFVSNIPHPLNKELFNITLYKLHGSEHFYESSLTGQPDSSELNFVMNPEIFPRSMQGGFTDISNAIGHYVIAPSFIKTPHVQMNRMFLDLIERAKAADKLVIIGCSLRKEDSSLWQLILAFHDNRLASKKIIICDPNAEQLKQVILSYYPSSMASYLDGSIETIPAGLEVSVDTLLEKINRR